MSIKKQSNYKKFDNVPLGLDTDSMISNKNHSRTSKSSLKRPSFGTAHTPPTSMIAVTSKTGLHQDTTSKSNTTRLSSSSTINEKVLRQEIYSKRSTGNESNNSSKISFTKVSEPEPRSGSLSQTLTSVLASVNRVVPNKEHDVRYTKLFLQKQGLHNMSIWSHLTDVLNKIIAEQPDNVIDYFEEYSRKVKQEKVILHDTFRDVYIPSPHLESAKNQLSLVNAFGIKEDEEEPVAGEEEEGVDTPRKMDLEEMVFYFRQAGVAIPEVQLFTLNIAIKKLREEKKLVKPRFWGKIFGTKQDYFVLECELPEEEYEKRIEEEERVEAAEVERKSSEKLATEEEPKEQESLPDERIESIERESKLTKESKSIHEESLKEGETIKEVGNEYPLEVKFNLEANEEREEDDPNLPPLPPPKKLLKYKIPPVLQSVPKEDVKIPPEKLGQGINRKIYFVCNNPELEWQELPKVMPEQINIARQIKVFFTGDLESKLSTYPEFQGTEKNYLRAQIARISASTHVSPLGFYTFGGGEDEEEVPEEEEGVDQTTFKENPKFQPIPIKELIDPSLASWVHHSQHILKQGRTEWWSSKKSPVGEEEGEEEQEEEEEEEAADEGGEEKETGPALLSPLSDDATIEGKPAWTAKKSRNYNSDMAVAVIKSNLWPGATTFAVDKKYENVYFGWGHKHLPHGYSLPVLPHPEYEYDLGPEIMEIQDPTVEVEQAWREAHKKVSSPAKGEDEEEEGEVEDEEEEEEDDD